MTASGFENALQRLVTDKAFADAVVQDETVLTDVFVLSEAEKDVLKKIFETAHPGPAGAAVVIACYVACREA